MEWVIAAVVVVLLGLVALAATGRFGAMRELADRDVFVQPLPERPLHAPDLETVRFGVTLRGYAMNQVDDLLDRLAGELARRDAELEQLRVELDLPADTDPFAKYQLDGGQGVPAGGPWYDGDGHRDATPVTAGFPQAPADPTSADQNSFDHQTSPDDQHRSTTIPSADPPPSVATTQENR